MEGEGLDKLLGGGEAIAGSFMDLLTGEGDAAQAPPPQRLGSLAQPGPGERGSGAATPAGAGLTPAAQQQQQYAAYPGSFAPPAGGIPQQQAQQQAVPSQQQQQLAALAAGLLSGRPQSGLASGQQPVFAPAGNLGAQGEPPAKRQAIDPQQAAAAAAFQQFAMQPPAGGQQQQFPPGIPAHLAVSLLNNPSLIIPHV